MLHSYLKVQYAFENLHSKSSLKLGNVYAPVWDYTSRDYDMPPKWETKYDSWGRYTTVEKEREKVEDKSELGLCQGLIQHCHSTVPFFMSTEFETFPFFTLSNKPLPVNPEDLLKLCKPSTFGDLKTNQTKVLLLATTILCVHMLHFSFLA